MFELIYPDDAAPVIPAPDVNSAVARANSCSMQAGAVNVHPGKAAEYFPVIQENGMVIGRAERSYCHSPAKPLHPVVHLHVMNSRGELYLQKRPLWKDIQPGRWDTSVGGHVDLGENVDRALRREAREELGIKEFVTEQLYRYVFESTRERELVYSFRTVYEGEIRPSEELDGGRFWTAEEIRTNLGRGVFTPNFEDEWRRLEAVLQKDASERL